MFNGVRDNNVYLVWYTNEVPLVLFLFPCFFFNIPFVSSVVILALRISP